MPFYLAEAGSIYEKVVYKVQFIFFPLFLLQQSMFQTQFLRHLMQTLSCCGGNCSSANSDTPEIFFPDVSARILKGVLHFFLTGLFSYTFVRQFKEIDLFFVGEFKGNSEDSQDMSAVLYQMLGFPEDLTIDEDNSEQVAECIPCFAQIPVSEQMSHFKQHLSEWMDEQGPDVDKSKNVTCQNYLPMV